MLVRLRTGSSSATARVTLVRPPSVVTRFGLTLTATPPLSLAYLASSLEHAGHRVRIIDGIGEALDQFAPSFAPSLLCNGLSVEQIVARIDPDTQLIGVSCMFSHEWPVVRGLIQRIAEQFPGVPIVLGGEHATALPELCLRECPGLSACALGEGEQTIVELAEVVAASGDLHAVAGLVVRSGEGTVRTSPRARIRDIDELPEPAWHLTPIHDYLARGLSFGVDRGPTMPLLATRGCPYRCTFCSNPSMWTTRYTLRSPSRVVDEIARHASTHGATNFDFYDLTAVVRRRWIVEFCQELLRRRLDVTWQLPSGTRSEAIDLEVARLMYASGCRNISYAPESGSLRTLAAVKKQVDPESILASMRGAVRAGLNVKANILIGFPDERPDDLLDTLRFVLRMARAGVHDVSIWTFVPYPGSELFRQLHGDDPELDDTYYAQLLSYSDLAGAVSSSAHLDADDLQRFRLLGLSAFYATSFALHPQRPFASVRNLLTRRLESRSEMSALNLVHRLRGELVKRSWLRHSAAGRREDSSTTP